MYNFPFSFVVHTINYMRPTFINCIIRIYLNQPSLPFYRVSKTGAEYVFFFTGIDKIKKLALQNGINIKV